MRTQRSHAQQHTHTAHHNLSRRVDLLAGMFVEWNSSVNCSPHFYYPHIQSYSSSPYLFLRSCVLNPSARPHIIILYVHTSISHNDIALLLYTISVLCSNKSIGPLTTMLFKEIDFPQSCLDEAAHLWDLQTVKMVKQSQNYTASAVDPLGHIVMLRLCPYLRYD